MILSRLTGTQYLDECFNMSLLKDRIAGTLPPTPSSFFEQYSKYFEGNDHYYVLGCFDEGQLISWIALGFSEQLKVDGLFWTVSGMFTSKFVPVFSFNNPEIGLLIKEAFKLAESKHYYEYYYSVADRISKVYERQIQKTQYIPIGRYDYIELATIPANTKPEKILYWKLMGEQMKPDTIIIKKRVLKPQYR